jgi:hypothetical protein
LLHKTATQEELCSAYTAVPGYIIFGDKDISTYTSQDALIAYEILKKFPSNWKKKKGLRKKSLTEIIVQAGRDAKQNSAGHFSILNA